VIARVVLGEFICAEILLDFRDVHGRVLDLRITQHLPSNDLPVTRFGESVSVRGIGVLA